MDDNNRINNDHCKHYSSIYLYINEMVKTNIDEDSNINEHSNSNNSSNSNDTNSRNNSRHMLISCR